MLILDTNHLAEIDRDSAKGRNLRQRLEGDSQDSFITIVSVEEILRGWLAELRRAKSSTQQVFAYNRFHRSVAELNQWTVLDWDTQAAERFRILRGANVRIGTLDLRIASIALEYGATLLTRNLADFCQVPELRVENWLD